MSNIDALIALFSKEGKFPCMVYMSKGMASTIKVALEAAKVKEEQFMPKNKPTGDFID